MEIVRGLYVNPHLDRELFLLEDHHILDPDWDHFKLLKRDRFMSDPVYLVLRVLNNLYYSLCFILCCLYFLMGILWSLDCLFVYSM